jgi:hypothetical protein
MKILTVQTLVARVALLASLLMLIIAAFLGFLRFGSEFPQEGPWFTSHYYGGVLYHNLGFALILLNPLAFGVVRWSQQFVEGGSAQSQATLSLLLLVPLMYLQWLLIDLVTRGLLFVLRRSDSGKRHG